MQRYIWISSAVVLLAACQPQVPDSRPGAGFGSYSDYMRSREGQYGAGQAMSPAQSPIASDVVHSQPLDPFTPAVRGETMMQGISNAPMGSQPQPIQTQPGQPEQGRLIGAATSLSDEQNFDAVASRESIASDAERRRRSQEQYVVLDAQPLPQRNGASGPNIVQYAVSTSHMPGTKMYSRSSIRFKSYEAACAPFTSADFAQEEFLRRGGPQRDALGVDPDGDGFACGWDPRPFRG